MSGSPTSRAYWTLQLTGARGDVLKRCSAKFQPERIVFKCERPVGVFCNLSVLAVSPGKSAYKDQGLGRGVPVVRLGCKFDTLGFVANE